MHEVARSSRVSPTYDNSYFMETDKIFPEFKNFSEIEKLIESDLQSQRDKGSVKAMMAATNAIVNVRMSIGGLRNTLGLLQSEMDTLNRSIKQSSESSDKLAVAIKNITLWGTIVAGVGVLTAVAALAFEIFKYYCP